VASSHHRYKATKFNFEFEFGQTLMFAPGIEAVGDTEAEYIVGSKYYGEARNDGPICGMQNTKLVNEF
jgi:hypothetical protein